MPDLIVMGVDPGFANFGYCLSNLADGLNPIKIGVIHTEKSDKKLNVLATSDNFARGRLIARDIVALIKQYNVRAICAEAMSHPRQASVAGKMSYSWGAMAAICEIYDIPMMQQSPQATKKVLLGKATATKDEVQLLVERRFPRNEVVRKFSAGKKGDWEHGFDACAAILSMENSELFSVLRKST